MGKLKAVWSRISQEELQEEYQLNDPLVRKRLEFYKEKYSRENTDQSLAFIDWLGNELEQNPGTFKEFGLSEFEQDIVKAIQEEIDKEYVND